MITPEKYDRDGIYETLIAYRDIIENNIQNIENKILKIQDQNNFFHILKYKINIIYFMNSIIIGSKFVYKVYEINFYNNNIHISFNISIY